MSQALTNLINLYNNSINLNNSISLVEAKKLLIEANIMEEDLLEFANYDHPVDDCYGRQLVYDGGKFEIMVMSWKPGDYSSIHNHGFTEWGVVKYFGNAHHIIYNFDNHALSFNKKEILMKDSVLTISNALIHQMGNSTSKPFLTLHIYGSNSKNGNITADAMNFDLEFDRISLTSGGAFFNLKKEAIHKVEKGAKPSIEVFTHYAYLLMDYYNRQESSETITDLKTNLLSKLKEAIL